MKKDKIIKMFRNYIQSIVNTNSQLFNFLRRKLLTVFKNFISVYFNPMLIKIGGFV